MDRGAIFWAARVAIAVVGIILMFKAARLVGRARAAANWPTVPPVAALSEPLGWAGITAAVLSVAAAAGLSLATLAGPSTSELLPQTSQAWLLAGVGALAVLLAGAGGASRLIGRAELAVLIRTRSGRQSALAAGERLSAQARPDGPVGPVDARPDGPVGPVGPPGSADQAGLAEPAARVGAVDPIVPTSGQPGWVYQDRTGAWYLCVAAGTGRCLVRLDTFTLVPPGTAEPPLTLRGSVEISVYPVAVP